jgi:predicted dehydrogenase
MRSPARAALAGLQHAHIEQVIEEIRRRSDKVALVAIAEADVVVRERYRSRLGVTAYADHREMLEAERPDAVAIASINSERGSVIVDALRAGAHVVADKPLCTTAADLDAIRRAWSESGRIVHCLLEKRLWSETLAARQVLRSGELGELVLAWASAPHRLNRPSRPDWMFRQQSYGGILNDLAIHDLDLLLDFTGAAGGWVQGWTGNAANPELPEFEDHGVILLRTGTGLTATVEVHWLSPEAAPYHGDYRIVLTGTRGTAELRFAAGEVTVATHQSPPRKLEPPPRRSAAADFFDAVEGGGRPCITSEQVFAATAIALAAQTHANDGSWHRWRRLDNE